MLYHDSKKEALEIHERAVKKYNELYGKVQDQCQRLYQKRKDSLTLIAQVEKLVNSIANSPKEFETALSNIDEEKAEFRKTEEYAEEAFHTAVKAGVNIAAGAASGAAVAAMAPTAAMWVATTFGTASTGTAISTLSGAAATKAALAWLGGGALSAGGFGVAGGQALLALAGPIGWGIAGTAVATSAIFTGRKNKKIAQQAMDEAKKITIAGAELNESTAKIGQLLDETDILTTQLSVEYAQRKYLNNANYNTLAEEEQLQLGALVNNTLSLAKLLNKTV